MEPVQTPKFALHSLTQEIQLSYSSPSLLNSHSSILHRILPTLLPSRDKTASRPRRMVTTWTRRLAKRVSNEPRREEKEDQQAGPPPAYEPSRGGGAVDIGSGDMRDLVDIEEIDPTFWSWYAPSVAGIGGALFGTLF